MPEEKPHNPEFVARKEVGLFFPGADGKTLANRNCRGLGPKPYKGDDSRLIFYEYQELRKHYTGQ